MHAAVAAIYAKTRSLSGEWPFPQHRAQFGAGPPRNVRSLAMLSADLSRLQRAVDGADAAPSPDALAAYRLLSQQLAGTLAKWRRLQQVDLPRVNAQLKAAGEAAVGD